MPDDTGVREAVRTLLREGRAHVSFEKAVANLPEALRGKKARGVPYTLWQQLEHMRIAQWDILEYIRNPQHVSPEFPQGYWPREAAPARKAWAESVKAFLADRQALLVDSLGVSEHKASRLLSAISKAKRTGAAENEETAAALAPSPVVCMVMRRAATRLSTSSRPRTLGKPAMS